jgi:hypothetical protein
MNEIYHLFSGIGTMREPGDFHIEPVAPVSRNAKKDTKCDTTSQN